MWVCRVLGGVYRHCQHGLAHYGTRSNPAMERNHFTQIPGALAKRGRRTDDILDRWSSTTPQERHRTDAFLISSAWAAGPVPGRGAGDGPGRRGGFVKGIRGVDEKTRCICGAYPAFMISAEGVSPPRMSQLKQATGFLRNNEEAARGVNLKRFIGCQCGIWFRLRRQLRQCIVFFLCKTRGSFSIKRRGPCGHAAFIYWLHALWGISRCFRFDLRIPEYAIAAGL